MNNPYESWTFKDRSFLLALVASLIWHLFWFFSITITVDLNKHGLAKARPVIVSLGPVLDDTIFKTLAQGRPQLSETFYRRAADFSPVLDLEFKTLERHAVGEVVSLPFGKKWWNSIRDAVGGAKAIPQYDFASRISIGYRGDTPSVEGDAKSRTLLSRPSPEPRFPAGFGPQARRSEAEFEFTLDPAGLVTRVETVVSSGYPDIDLLWKQYLKQWQFSALGVDRGRLDQKGRIRFRFEKHSGE